MCGSMADIQSAMVEIRRAKKKNKRQDENIYGLPYPIGRPKDPQGADGHRRRQHARLVAAYLQSQSQDCNLGPRGDFRNFGRSVTLTLTFDRIKVIPTSLHNTCRTTSMPNHPTVASRTTEIWPFEYRKISTMGEVCTPVTAFLEGNSKIGL